MDMDDNWLTVSMNNTGVTLMEGKGDRSEFISPDPEP